MLFGYCFFYAFAVYILRCVFVVCVSFLLLFYTVVDPFLRLSFSVCLGLQVLLWFVLSVVPLCLLFCCCFFCVFSVPITMCVCPV